MRHSRRGLLIGAGASLAVAVPAAAQLLGGGGLGGMTGGLGGSLGGSLGGTGTVGGTVDGVGRSVSGAVSGGGNRSEAHTSELQSLMRISYAVFCLKKKTQTITSSHLHWYHQHYQHTVDQSIHLSTSLIYHLYRL